MAQCWERSPSICTGFVCCCCLSPDGEPSCPNLSPLKHLCPCLPFQHRHCRARSCHGYVCMYVCRGACSSTEAQCMKCGSTETRTAMRTRRPSAGSSSHAASSNSRCPLHPLRQPPSFLQPPLQPPCCLLQPPLQPPCYLRPPLSFLHHPLQPPCR